MINEGGVDGCEEPGDAFTPLILIYKIKRTVPNVQESKNIKKKLKKYTS